MHALALNPSRTLLAAGGTHPNDAVILDLASYRPLLYLEGHQDWIFGMCFIRHDVLVTCGRDAAVAVWSIRNLPGSVLDAPVVRAPTLLRYEHTMKVRDIRYLESDNVR